MSAWHIFRYEHRTYVFALVTDILRFDDFNKFVKKYIGNHRVKTFSCWKHLLCMVFGLLVNRESLRDLVTCLHTQRDKWYHLGLSSAISKSNLAHANEHRDWRIYADFAYLPISSSHVPGLPARRILR